jgi:hypothetical protein
MPVENWLVGSFFSKLLKPAHDVTPTSSHRNWTTDGGHVSLNHEQEQVPSSKMTGYPGISRDGDLAGAARQGTVQ